ncbi:MAG: DegT/DnrJ/EryC1/StrS family aminotransferase [Planctomycetota bacterium]|nr:DegT/DnrJ/EryC1/StrS family aminotransferase [Planctomycetota bacterium]
MQEISEPSSERDGPDRDLGLKELGYVEEAIRSGVLNSTQGVFVNRLEMAFAFRVGQKSAVACSSGSAALHAAYAVAGLDSGDEVVTTPVTDMGALMPILYEGAVPVFCDVDPLTGNVTAAAIEAQMTDRTRAVVVTHLFGMPCDVEEILELVRSRDVLLIEDCAQAALAEGASGPVGSTGDLACYSFQQSKHMTTGEGGILTTNDDELHRLARKFINKGWGYGEDEPDHDQPGLNYRMTELQGAVGLAQLENLDAVVDRRRQAAARFLEALGSLPGVAAPLVGDDVIHSYWRMPLMIDPEIICGGPDAVAHELEERGLRSYPRYIQKPAFSCAVFEEWARFPLLRRAYEAAARTPPPSMAEFPGVASFLSRVLVLPWSEEYSQVDVDEIVALLREICVDAQL